MEVELRIEVNPIIMWIEENAIITAPHKSKHFIIYLKL